MDDETCCENRNHNCYDRERHEVTAKLIPTLWGAPCAFEEVNDCKEVDSCVKKHEDDQEETCNTHDELLAD